MTEAMKSALDKFTALGCDGIIDRYGRMLVMGETIKHVAPETWLRLILAGHIEARNGRFWRIREAGE